MDVKWLAVFLAGRIVWVRQSSERSSAWLEHLVWDQDVAGSNPVAPTTFFASPHHHHHHHHHHFEDVHCEQRPWKQVLGHERPRRRELP